MLLQPAFLYLSVDQHYYQLNNGYSVDQVKFHGGFRYISKIKFGSVLSFSSHNA